MSESANVVVLVKVNVFLMIIALLPIGPFDGHAAWQVIPRTRAKLKRPPKAKLVSVPKPAPEPEVTLSPEKQRELDASSERAAAELMAKLTGKSGTPSDGDRRS